MEYRHRGFLNKNNSINTPSRKHQDNNPLCEYIKFHYEKIPKTYSNGKFIATPFVSNDKIKKKNFHFYDNLISLDTGAYQTDEFGDGVFGPSKVFEYNYFTKNGDPVFEYDKDIVLCYIGRNIFIHMYDDEIFYLCSPNKQKKAVVIGLWEFTYTLDGNAFIKDLVEELNKKYMMEDSGLKYKLSKKTMMNGDTKVLTEE